MNPFRLPFFLFPIFAAMAAPSRGPAAAAPKAPPPHERPAIGSKSWIWEDLEYRPTPAGGRRDINNSPSGTLRLFEAHATTLLPGRRSHEPHRHAREEFILVKEGKLEVHINGRTQRAGPGSVLFYASGDAHNVTNVGSEPAVYLVFNYETGLTASAPPEGVEAATAAGRLSGAMASAVHEWTELPATTTPAGERRQILAGRTATLQRLSGHATTIRAGLVAHAPHRHADEELVVVKDGLIEAAVDGVATRGGPGSMFFFASNSFHGMKNVGETNATYYVFRFVSEATPAVNPQRSP